MSYRVFARKYRPQTFEEVVGQDHITRTLQNAITTNRLAQAYLFVGPRGIGKTSTARILAKALNCINGPTTTPCGVCDACREIADGRNLDVIEIDGASNNGVENIRDLRDNAAYAPARGPFKIYLIDEVHMLSAGAFNALLKTLEEPPPHVKFIFATTEPQKLPATITSRCQRFDLRRIPADLISKHLTFIGKSEEIELEQAASEAIARGADGGLRDAESMLDQMVAFCGKKITAQDVMDVFGFTPAETVAELADRIFTRDAKTSLALIAEQSDAGKDLARLTMDLIAHLRDLLIAQAVGNKSSIPQSQLLELIDHFNEAETRMKWVADKKLQLDVAVIKAIHLLDETSLTDVIETLSALSSGEPAPKLRTPQAKATKKSRNAEDTAEVKASAPSQKEEIQHSRDSETKGVCASTIWETIVEKFAKESFIRFGWLREGVFGRLEEGCLFVRFPSSSKEYSETIFMEKGQQDLESLLTRELGQAIRLIFEFDESMNEPPPKEPSPLLAEEPAAPPPHNPLDEFKNDALIKKALEVFKSTLQTAST